MCNIVLRSENGKSFKALVGFTLVVDLPIIGFRGFDYYGLVCSDEQGVAVVSTYLGRGDVEFRFFVNMDLEQNPITASSTGEDQNLPPNATYPPHWYQQLGFYG